MNLRDIPAVNAGLNALATVLMTFGFGFIVLAKRAVDPAQRSAQVRRHRACMLLAGVVSAGFLIGYVFHKILVRGVHTPFGGTGMIAKVYYTMLVTHVILAIAIAYLVPRAFYFALGGSYDRHQRWARWTFPLWYYVSITGVLVYYFLYQWWPAPPAGA